MPFSELWANLSSAALAKAFPLCTLKRFQIESKSHVTLKQHLTIDLRRID